MPLFVPGPVDVDPEIAMAQTRPMMPHRSAEYEEIFHRAEGNARKIFGTQSRVFLSTSSGTSMHEAAVRNLVPDGGRILSCSNGAFGNRWHSVATTNGKQADKLETKWNVPITADLVAEALGQTPYDILCVVHNETSTGLMNPIQEIAAAAQQVSPDTLVCIDAVSSASGAAIEMDAWGLDFVLTSSQKALALPPGLALGATSDRALEKARSVEHRGWYLDLVRLEDYRLRNSTPATSAVSLIYALDDQLQRIITGGLAARYASYQAMAERVHRWATERGHGLFAPEGYRSPTVSTVLKSETLDIGALNAHLAKKDMRIAGGYGPIKPSTFRIAHMGELTMADIEAVLAEIDAFLGV